MKIVIRTRDLDLTPELLDRVRRRAQFALGRLGPAIRGLDVTLADVNGPRGGVDKLCRMRVRGDDLPTVVVEATDLELTAAIDAAAERAGRAVVRARQRRRGFAAIPRLAPQP
ncbi:MAG: HPF/RaiA family ribosome-associated protein [Myxococcales bacterium]|nr:HPF/RaiA family ribosome-associated protein [Myxococcales bacterium]